MKRLLSLLALCCALTISAARADGASDNAWVAPPPKQVRDADFAAGQAAIDARDWGTAIDRMLRVVQRDPKNANAENWLGYAYRKSGDLPNAFRHYDRALALNPAHLGAHEYLGEAYLQARDLAGAERQLAELARLCSSYCEQYFDLKAQVDAARQLAGATPQ